LQLVVPGTAGRRPATFRACGDRNARAGVRRAHTHRERLTRVDSAARAEIRVVEARSRTSSTKVGLRSAPPRCCGLKFVTSASMASSASRVSALLVVAAVAVTVNACTPKPDGPEPTAQKFFAALATGDTAAAAGLSDRPADARESLNDA